MLVDSHCHLDFPELAEDLAGVVRRASDAGVSHLLCVGINLSGFPGMKELTSEFPNISLSVGVHPNETCDPDEEPDAGRLTELAHHSRVIALGETGLDYFRSEAASSWQKSRFAAHIEAAKTVNKPIIVHCRDAAADTLSILRGEDARDCGGVMHCFVEDWTTARAVLDLGFYISFSGIVTFKSATDLREVAKKVPMDRLLVETDAPYLAPHPFRGKTNEPAFVVNTARCIADLRGVEFETFAMATTANFKRLFAGAQLN